MNSSTHAAAAGLHTASPTPVDAGLMQVTIDDGGPALEQHCTNVPRRPQPRAQRL